MIDSVLGTKSRLFSTGIGMVILFVGFARDWSALMIFYALFALTMVLLVVAGAAAARQIIKYRKEEDNKE